MSERVSVKFRNDFNGELILEFSESEFDRLEISKTGIRFTGFFYPLEVVQRYMEVAPACCKFLSRQSTMKERQKFARMVKEALKELDFVVEDEPTY